MAVNSSLNNLEINGAFKKAFALIEGSSVNVLITGSAGTGKSTFIEYFMDATAKNAVVLAPTGVAALNAGGMTIHSFFGFGPDITVDKVRKARKSEKQVYLQAEVIVIDEVSMVRADLLDCVDRFLRLNGRNPDKPFGGAQMVFVGDLYQLPPVVNGREEREIFSGHYESEYFFDSKVFREIEYSRVSLDIVYRQKDPGFIEILDRIRVNSVTDDDLAVINSRFFPGFGFDEDDFFVCLTTTNKLAASINEERLLKNPGPPVMLEAEIEGDCRSGYFPTDTRLTLKEGAQVMLLNNDPLGRWVNGTIGRVHGIMDHDGEGVLVELPEGVKEIFPYKWRVYRFVYNRETGAIEAEESGCFKQYPLKLAWAVTIHKSQGKTFERVVIDTGRGTFACGQMYVALSRCTSLEGIHLRRPAEKRHMLVDERVVRFFKNRSSGS